MASVSVSVSGFRANFPEFSPDKYTDGALELVLAQAQLHVSPRNGFGLNGSAREYAIYLMTAHLRAMADMAASGQITGRAKTASSIYQVSVSYAMPPAKDMRDYWLGLTTYGLQLKGLLKARTAAGFFFGGEAEDVFR